MNAGAPLKVLVFDEGAPWDVYCNGLIKGRDSIPEVKEVFEWIATEGVRLDNLNHVPDQVLVDQQPSIPNYPKSIVYADMSGNMNMEEKEHLLSSWKF